MVRCGHSIDGRFLCSHQSSQANSSLRDGPMESLDCSASRAAKPSTTFASAMTPHRASTSSLGRAISLVDGSRRHAPAASCNHSKLYWTRPSPSSTSLMSSPFWKSKRHFPRLAPYPCREDRGKALPGFALVAHFD